MATLPIPEAAARSPEVVAEPVAPLPSVVAAAFAESRWMPLPPELARPQALPSEPTLFLSPAPERLPDPEPLPNPAAGAKPHQPPTFLHYLLFATGAAVALAAVLVFADNSRKPAGDPSAGSLLTGTTYPAKPSADGEPLQPQPAHHSRTPAPTPADSEPNPPDSAASPDPSAQPAPTGNDPSPAPAETPQANAPPDNAHPTPAPPA